ncbi:MAG TPA: Flp family type IVb pilin [Acetobacteraceae bacterium]|nr:Flp family type IVb pilin [Acetobacteraceae bacterium]
MLELVKTWLELKYDRRAVTALEYGLIAAAIAAVIAAVVFKLGTDINSTFNNVAASL